MKQSTPTLRSVRRLRRSSSLAALLLFALAAHPNKGMGFSVCVNRWLFHGDCPACGITRSASSLLHADAHQAITYHPFGPLVVLALAGIAILGLLPTQQLAAVIRFRRRHDRPLKQCAHLLIAVFIVHGVIRLLWQHYS